MKDFEVLYHSSIKIGEDVYIDPFNIQGGHYAKYIFITHSHYDHYSLKDILKIYSKDSTIVATQDVIDDLKNNNVDCELLVVSPNQKINMGDIVVETFASYNVNKQFHPKQNNWVGYKLAIDNTTYLVAGDSDMTDELKCQKCDILFVPIGGTYTMDSTEAAALTNIIRPHLVVPTHYNAIVGNKKNEQQFLQVLDKDIDCKIFL